MTDLPELVLDLQDFSKGNKRDTTDGQEITGSRDETANTHAQKPVQKNDKKDTKKDMKAWLKNRHTTHNF